MVELAGFVLRENVVRSQVPHHAVERLLMQAAGLGQHRRRLRLPLFDQVGDSVLRNATHRAAQCCAGQNLIQSLRLSLCHSMSSVGVSGF